MCVYIRLHSSSNNIIMACTQQHEHWLQQWSTPNRMSLFHCYNDLFSAGSTLRFLSQRIANGSKLTQSGQHRRCLQLRDSCCLKLHSSPRHPRKQFYSASFTFSPLFACTAHLHLLMNLLSWYLFSLQYLLFSQFILSFHTCFATPTLSPQDSRCIFIQFSIHVYEIYATLPLLPKFYITELIPVSPRLSCTAK